MRLGWRTPRVDSLKLTELVYTRIENAHKIDKKTFVIIYQRWPESLFQTPTPLLFQNFSIRSQQFFKFENPTPVQTPTTIIGANVIHPCFYLRYYRTDSCYCQNWKVTLIRVRIFPKFLTPDRGPKEKRRIMPESTPEIRIRCYLCYLCCCYM